MAAPASRFPRRRLPAVLVVWLVAAAGCSGPAPAGFRGRSTVEIGLLDRVSSVDRTRVEYDRDAFLVSLDLFDYRLDPADLAEVARLPRLETLLLGETAVDDDTLGLISGLTTLKTLGLRATAVTDAGLVHLSRMTDLRTLLLAGTAVTDEGLKTVARLELLEGLGLNATAITDAGLGHLAGLSHLRELHVAGTSVTPGAVERLQQALPELKVFGPDAS